MDASSGTHPILSHEEWLKARIELLQKEKEFTRLRDALSQIRRELPWERVEKEYFFDGPSGKESLKQLFAGRKQLIIYHFMFNPEWENGCKSCSFWADNFERNVIHLNQRDVTLVAISRAPPEKLEAFRQRMGWTFKWLSSMNNDFNYDYYVSFKPGELAAGEVYYNYRMRKTSMTDLVGISVFFKDSDDQIFHTYSCYERGVDMMNAAYHYLDLVPKGRGEDDTTNKQEWVRFRDAYSDRSPGGLREE
jgi:predicted dithiol-disulfide oxidoreductase (DUF899 family)